MVMDPQQRQGQPDGRAAGYLPRVVVKFHDHVDLNAEDLSGERPERLTIGPWQRLREEFPGIELKRLFTDVKPEEIRRLTERAVETDPEYRPPNLLSYFAVDCPPGIDAQSLAKRLTSWRSVETAYVEGGPTPPPAVNPADDPRFPNQGYLDPAVDGIDAEYAWTFTGGDGAGIQFIDCEQGWTLNHEDLMASGISLLSGVNQAYFGHGTAVLGEVTAVDNSTGCVGIAPHVATRVVSQYRTPAIYNTAEAILSAVAALAFGDVLLLEAQTTYPGHAGYLPVEVEAAVYDVIRLGTALGVVIVEAAGNGSEDLDAFTDALGHNVLDRASADFKDSGAILVGAASAVAPHGRLAFSNYGSRIDCYGWGESIDTTGDGWTGNLTTTYTASFGGTSGASPIVAGAAIAVQGIAESNLGYRFSPRQLRAILSATGTPSDNPAVDRIGVMPDLKQIIDVELGVAPDVYLRDFVGDAGDPHVGAVSASPDVILRPTAEADPQAAFGEGSGTENSNALGAEAEAGQDNYIYVRVRNRGGGAAANVTATVYWSPPATLVTPDLWTLVGSVTLANVPDGDVLTVSDALVWPAAAIPGTGHYCFVGLIGNAQDPSPEPASFVDWDNFIRYIRENNNVTWRNFNVVNNVPPAGGPPPGYVALPFLAPGAPDRARPMQLEVMARLPHGARALLELPHALFQALRDNEPAAKVDRKRGMATLAIHPHGRLRLGEALFPAKSRSQLRLLVHIPEERRKEEHEIAIRQLYKGEEVGRITWRLSPRGKRRPGRESEYKH